MSVKRYDVMSYSLDVDGNSGPFVKYEDYAALEARCAALAAENAGLLPKAASELSNAWVLHKYLIGIQAAIMYLDNGNKKAAQEWLYGTIAGPGFEFPDAVDDIDAWATHQMRGSVSHQQALEIIKAETPATDAFLAEVRAQGVDSLVQRRLTASRLAKEAGHEITARDLEDEAIRARLFAMELRKGVQS
ncbi:hypothetical protein VLI49_001633 [Enterobacter kobei]|nr:hypothetical protein [Enterobacter kobei]